MRGRGDMIHAGCLKTYISPGSWNSKAWTMCPTKARPTGGTETKKEVYGRQWIA